MKIEYDPRGDAAYVTAGAEVVPGSIADNERFGEDRRVDYDAEGRVLGYEFLNVRRFGVDVAGLPHADKVAAAFKARGFRVTEGIGAD
jgi:YD repeat-containing protein